MSKMSLMLFTHYLFGYIGTALCSIGLVLALCSVYIFTRRQMRSTVATYLAGLSLSDSCLLSLGLIIAINSLIPPSQQSQYYYSSHLHKYLFPYIYGCIIWFQFTSVWITIAFAIDRWFAIKWPIIHYTYSSKRACYIVLMIYCLGFIYSFPRFFEYKTEAQHEQFVTDNFTEDYHYLVVTNRLLENRVYHYIVHLTLYSLFQSILPLLMLSYFNVELIRSIHASSNFLKRFTSLYTSNTQYGRETSHRRYREGTVTRSVICLIALFILCQVPASILHYIFMFYRNHPILYICYDISNFLILVNSAVNFFIFTYFNRKFRRELSHVCLHSNKNRTFLPHTSSHQSFQRKNSYSRPQQQQNLPLIDIPSNNIWEYPKSSNRLFLQIESTISSESLQQLQNRLSISSDSFQNSKHYSNKEKFSIYEFKRKKSQNQRRTSDAIFTKRKKPSIIINHYDEPLNYINYKYDKKKFISKFSPRSSSSNCTHSTLDATLSDSSHGTEQIQYLKPNINIQPRRLNDRIS